MSKVVDIYVKLYHDHSPNMVVSRDMAGNVGHLYFFCLILYQYLGKLPNLGEISLTTKSDKQNAKLGVKNTGRPPNSL